MKKIGLIASQLSLLSFSALALHIPAAFAQGNPSVQIQETGLVKTPSLSGLLEFFVGAAIVLAIVLALLFMIIGGIQWITSSGDKAKVDAARQHIVSAVIGLIVVVLAVAILNFVLQLLGLGSIFGGFTLPTLNNPNAGGSNQ